MPFDPLSVKAESELAIRKLGGKVCDWLPSPDQTTPRTQEELVGRALVMNALLNIHFKAPIAVVKRWIEEHDLERHLSVEESDLLQKTNDQLSQQQRTNLYWYIEGLWALMWAGSLVADLNPAKGVPGTMASLVPSLQRNETGAKFSERMHLRSYEELFRMLDLYYRLHWWVRDAQLNRYPSDPVSIDIIMERRKSLEWLLDSASDWDHIELST